MARKFQTGDLVRLVSDTAENTPMTVRGSAYDVAVLIPSNEMYKNTGKLEEMCAGQVTCDWRDKNDVPHQKNFYEDELVKCNSK